jgi:type IV secretory pathway ATPase VirB11/archaellum biosynthesis ATPase
MKTFDIRKEINDVDVGKKKFSISQIVQASNETTERVNYDFYDVIKRASKFIEDEIGNRIKQDNKQEDYVEIKHRAMLGDKIAIQSMKQLIQDFIIKSSLSQIKYPKPYKSLVEGIFEEAYGWGPLGYWRNHLNNSAKAQIIGTDIFLEIDGNYVIQKGFSFRNINAVNDLTERLKNSNRKNKLDEIKNTELLTNTIDGIRVSIVIPERSYEPTITFRRQIVKTYNFETQTKLQTIPQEGKEVFKILSKLPLSSVIGGPPQCGKSTFLMTMLNETENLNQTAFVESEFEMYPRVHFPKSQIVHVRGEKQELESIVFPMLLRKDINRLVVAEIREHEAEIFASGLTRGIRQVMGTIHELDPIDIPEILSTLSLRNSKGNLNQIVEYTRFAKSLHFSISMDETEDEKGSKKKVTGIQFYDLDPSTLEVSIYRIVHYDWESDAWTYHNEIPKKILAICNKKHKSLMKELQNLLDDLSKKHPMPAEERKIKSLTLQAYRAGGGA